MGRSGPDAAGPAAVGAAGLLGASSKAALAHNSNWVPQSLSSEMKALVASPLEANLGQGPWCDVVGSLLAQLMDASPPSPPRRSGVVAEQGGDNGVNPRDRVSACRLGPGEEAAALALVPAG